MMNKNKKIIDITNNINFLKLGLLTLLIASFLFVSGISVVQAQTTNARRELPQHSVRESKLLSPQNSAILMIDHQPGVAFPIQSIDREMLVNNSTALTKVAMAFKVPLVLSTIREDSSGPLFAEILAAASSVPVIARPTRRNAWGDPNFVQAVERTRRKKLVMAGLWTEVCLALTSQSALEAVYEVYIVTDGSGGTSKEAHDIAVMRMVQAGAIPVTWLQVMREYLDPNQTPEISNKVREIDKQHAGALGLIWELNENSSSQ